MAFTSTGSDRSSVDDRFGYVEKGTFRHSYGNEKPLLIISAGLFFAAYLGIVFGIMFPNYGSSSLMFFTIIGVILFFVDIFIFATAYNIIMLGKEASYYADSVKFTVTVSGKRDIFYYEDVHFVRFEHFSAFGRPRGYHVTVITRAGEYRYSYLAPKHKKYGSPEDTPFFILKQKSEKDTTPEENRLLYSDADLERPVVHMVYSKTAENSVHQNVPDHWKPENKVKILNSENEMIITKGVFRVPHENEVTRYALLAFMLVAGICLGLLLFFILKIGKISDYDTGPILYPITALAWIFLVGTLFNHTRDGKDISYEMDGKEFRLKGNGTTKTLYLCDVEDVEYLPLMLLCNQRGYRVKITTKYTTIEYKYLFPRNRKNVPTNHTPFFYIEEKIGKAKAEQPSYRRTM